MQAYLQPTPDTDAALQALRLRLRDRLRLPSRWATGRASCTPPASSTRATPGTGFSCSSRPTIRRTSPFPMKPESPAQHQLRRAEDRAGAGRRPGAARRRPAGHSLPSGGGAGRPGLSDARTVTDGRPDAGGESSRARRAVAGVASRARRRLAMIGRAAGERLVNGPSWTSAAVWGCTCARSAPLRPLATTGDYRRGIAANVSTPVRSGDRG